MKFVHAADIHLDSPLHGLERYEGAPLHEMRLATRRAFENLVDLCTEEAVDLLLLAGDLYDGDWRDFGTGLFFSKQMVRLRDANVRVFLVRGNHDAASRITKNLRLPDNVHQFSSRKAETVKDEALGIAVHGQSFAREEVTDDLSKQYPKAAPHLFNIGILHTSADGRPGHANYAPCKKDDLIAKGYQYWALGHVHAREVLNEEPWIVFPGNLQGRHIRETGPKGCTVVTVEDGEVVTCEERAVDVVRWELLDLDASGCDTPAKVLDHLDEALRAAVSRADGRTCAARVRVTGPCGAHAKMVNRRESCVNDARALALEIGSGAIWLEKVLIETSPNVDFAKRAAGSGPLAELLQYVESLRDDEPGLAALAEKFTDLGAKLPVDLREGADALHLDSKTIKDLLQGTPSILLPRLLDDEESR
jgi:DNA repair protein SbcD/Mre11